MKKLVALLLALAMVFSLTACGGSEETTAAAEEEETTAAAEEETEAAETQAEETEAAQEATGEPIKIGFFAPITSAAASADGESTRDSVEAAVELLNAAGGINGRPVELVIEDDQLDTAQAQSIAEKFAADDSIVAVISGSYSGPTRVAAPIFQQAGKVMVSAYAVHPDVVNAGDYIFSQSFPGKVQATAAAYYAVNDLQAKKIAIIGVDLDFGTEQAAAFKSYAEANGAEIVFEQMVAISDNEFASIITQVKALEPDLIYLPNYYGHAAEILKQCKQQGLECQVLGCEGADSWQFFETAGDNAEGFIITTNLNRDSADEATQAYMALYTEKTGRVPDMTGASAYDAIQILFEALKAVGPDDSAALRDYIAGMTNVETVTGNLIRYTSAGSAMKAVQVQQVQNGAFHYYGEVTDESIIDPDQY